MNLIPIAESVDESILYKYKRHYNLESLFNNYELFFIKLKYKGEGYDSFFHYQIILDYTADNLHSNPASLALKNKISILKFLSNWSYIKRSLLRFICSGVCDVFNKNNWWITLEQKLTFHLLKKHYIDDFTGDRSSVDNHLFYLKYLAKDEPQVSIYIDFLENEIKNKLLDSGSEKSIKVKQHLQFQIINSKKLIKVLESLQELSVIKDWKIVYNQFSYPDKEQQEWGFYEYIELNFFIRLLEIYKIIESPSFNNKAIQFVFKLKNNKQIDPERLKKERQRKGISTLNRSNFKDFLLKENNRDLINIANAVKNADEEVDD